jgi:hypothetical protein
MLSFRSPYFGEFASSLGHRILIFSMGPRLRGDDGA